jgi:hypothetical protein
MAATKLLLLRRRPARIIFDCLALSTDAEDRFQVANALVDVASVDPGAGPQDMLELLATDTDDLVAAKAHEALVMISERPELQRNSLSPFGL